MIITTVITNTIIARFCDTKSFFTRCYIIIFTVICIFYTLAYVLSIYPAFTKGKKKYLWEQNIIVQNKIRNGVRPRDISLIDIDFNSSSIMEKKCMLYNYYHYLDSKEYSKLDQYILKFLDIIGNINNISISNAGYAYEILFFYSIINPDIIMAEKYMELLENMVKKDTDANGRRVYAAYLYGTNKPKDMILKVIDQGLYQTDRNSTLVASKMEIELLSQLKLKVNGGI